MVGWLVSGSDDQTIRIWDLTAKTNQLVRKLRGHQDEVRSLALSADGTTLLSGGKDGMLFCWTLSANRPLGGPLALPKAESTPAAFLHDGQSVATIVSNGAVAIYDLYGGQPPDILDVLGTNNNRLTVAPRSGWLACGSDNGSIRIWSLTSRSIVTNLAVSTDGLALPADLACRGPVRGRGGGRESDHLGPTHLAPAY